MRKNLGTQQYVFALVVLSLFFNGVRGLPSAFAANEMAQFFTYQGQFFNEAGTSPLLDTVDLTLEIMDPASACLLYSEQQNAINLNTTTGVFALAVGSLVGASKRVSAAGANQDPGLSFSQIFSNTSQVRAAGTNCAAGYTPAAGDGRVLRVIVDDVTLSTVVTLSPDLAIGASPQSVTAQSLQGIVPSGFIQVDSDMTQANADTLTSGVDASALHNHDSRYVKLNSASSQNLGTGVTYTTGDLGVGTSTPGARIESDAVTATTVGEIIKGAASQTADLLDFENSSGTVMTSVNSAGVLTIGGSPAATQGYVATQLSSYLPLAGGALTGPVTNSSSYTTTGGVYFSNGGQSVGFLPPTSTPAGTVTWTLPAADGTANQFLQTNGAGGLQWATGSAGAPSAFSFTNQTGVNLNVTITSNTVTLSGFTGLLSAACTGCTGIVRNGIVNGNTAAFLPGDTVALQVTSSSSPNTAVTASLTIGGTTSGTWSVTSSNDAPNAFSFTNQTGVVTNTTITSNTITLGGSFSSLTATCNAGCAAISHNGAAFTAGPISGINSGDTIAIQLLSSSSSLTAVTASLSVGATTSGTWSATTMTDPCVGSPLPGALCADGTVYAGLSPDGNNPMYTTRCDAGQSWNGSACTGSAIGLQWSTQMNIVTGVASAITGRSNSATVVSDNGNADAPYSAVIYCNSLTTSGHTDWYLPAETELNVLYNNYAALGSFNLGGNCYWSSTEYNSAQAYGQQFSSGSSCGFNDYKTMSYLVRCVRRSN